jgi:cysteinyl-tRNA synthetase
MDNAQIDALVEERDTARAMKDYARADEIREQLSEVRLGFYRIALLDEPSGTFWHWTANG